MAYLLRRQGGIGQQLTALSSTYVIVNLEPISFDRDFPEFNFAIKNENLSYRLAWKCYSFTEQLL